MRSKAYQRWLHYAARRAHREQRPIALYRQGYKTFFLRAFHEFPPPNAQLVCVAQSQGDDRVQLRFTREPAETVHITNP
jgi:hypothetical protein